MNTSARFMLESKKLVKMHITMGVDDKADKEDEAGQQEQVTCDGLLPDQCAAALWLFDFYGGSSQENHQTFRLVPVK